MAARGALGEIEDLWVVLGWVTRMRWALCVTLFVIACAHEVASGTPIPHVPILGVGVVVFGLNHLYSQLLRRWQGGGPETRQRLKILACTQVAVDSVLLTFVLHLTGGMRSPLWFFYMPDLLGTLFFSRRAVTAMFALFAAALYCGMGLVDGTWNSAAAVQVFALGVTATVIAIFLSGYFASVHYSALRTAKLVADKEAAEALSQRKDQVLSLVSHELNNPIMALRWAIHGARKAREKGSGQLDKMFARVDSQTNRLTRIVGDLYDVTSVENGRLRIQPRACEVMTVLEEALEPIRELHPKMVITLEGPPHLSAHWDVERIEQLVTNLLINAAKYAGPSARVDVRVLRGADDDVTIQVHDDGPGIPSDRVSRVFEPFQRFDARGVSRGLGLGLALARQIAELHAGAIWVESVVGEGSTFFVRLPAEAEQHSCRRLSVRPGVTYATAVGDSSY